MASGIWVVPRVLAKTRPRRKPGFVFGSERVRESRPESELPGARDPGHGEVEGGEHLSALARGAPRPPAVCLLRRPADRQRQARDAPHPRARVQGPLRPLQDDEGLLRRAQGRPVEIEVEKKLNISGKFAIENEIGVERFNELCRQSVYEYVDEWRAFSERMAFWQDYDNAYWTLTSEYIQSVWWALSEMWKQNLVYKGFRVAPYCSRCATPLSSHELSQGYRDNVPDPSVYVRFRLKDQPDTSILAWTTTPWTLPGNVALAVGDDVDYIKVKEGDEFLILAEARLAVLKEPPNVVERMQGRDLVGLEYEPLYPYSVPEQGKAHYVVDADFVSTDEGTGVVHTSALYGVDDLRLCQEKGIPFKHTVGLDGKFLPYVEKFAGLHVKEADPVITDDLRGRGLLYKAETILHTYPECWRCKTPLIYYALDAWYIRTTERKAELIANNSATNWVPAHIKTGRMGDWLENNIDWQFSRTRYWGTPVPIWTCEKCGEQRIVSSASELGLADGTDLHRPFIDTVTLACEKCQGVMRRVPEVLDTWFDSGSMPFAQRGYPRKDIELFEETFPAEFISEAIDQTREQVPLAQRHVLDRWLMSRLNNLVASVNTGLDSYDAVEPARRIQRFVDDLSNWYIRRSRRRFWKSQSDVDKLAAYQTLYEALRTVAELMAPFAPFTADAIHRNLCDGRSVHLADFPETVGAEDAEVEGQMARARQAVEAGLAARDAARLKVRQPLASIALPGDELPEEIVAIIRDELNVKKVTFGAPEVGLDTEITELLKLEGLAREIVRVIQDRRKRLGFNVEDRIDTRYDADGMLVRAIERHADYIKSETLSVTLKPGREDGFEGEQGMIEGEQIWIGLKRS